MGDGQDLLAEGLPPRFAARSTGTYTWQAAAREAALPVFTGPLAGALLGGADVVRLGRSMKRSMTCEDTAGSVSSSSPMICSARDVASRPMSVRRLI